MEQNEGQNEQEDAQDAELEIDQDKLERYMQKMRSNQSLSMGVLSGALASLIGAGIWAAITVLTEYQIGYMAIGVGLLVGMAVKIFGKGIDQVFRFIGALFSLVGCLLGNLFTIIIFAAINENVPILELALNLDINILVSVMAQTFEIMDLFFYGIAVYAGFRFSINSIPEDDLKQLAKE